MLKTGNESAMLRADKYHELRKRTISSTNIGGQLQAKIPKKSARYCRGSGSRFL